MPIDAHKVFAVSGEAGDRVNFTEYIAANVRLYALRNGVDLSTKAVAHFTRGELATALRKSPYQTNLLIAGFDQHCGPSLYWCDYLATMHHMNICGTGYGSYFVLSLFDKLWKEDLTEGEALEMMKKGAWCCLRLFLFVSDFYRSMRTCMYVSIVSTNSSSCW